MQDEKSQIKNREKACVSCAALRIKAKTLGHRKGRGSMSQAIAQKIRTYNFKEPLTAPVWSHDSQLVWDGARSNQYIGSYSSYHPDFRDRTVLLVTSETKPNTAPSSAVRFQSSAYCVSAPQSVLKIAQYSSRPFPYLLTVAMHPKSL